MYMIATEACSAKRGTGVKLILGGINGKYLVNITENAAHSTASVVAAVAYANKAELLFDWCRDNKIPLTFYGRLDPGVAVSIPILERFLSLDPNYRCLLTQHHHAKVIWWKGFGMYIGSANLTDKAWYKNIEAGCFFLEEEISDDMALDVEMMFAKLHSEGTPVTRELINAMKARQLVVNNGHEGEEAFWALSSVRTWDGLTVIGTKRAAAEASKKRFLEEWFATIELIRKIGEVVSEDANRPSWVNSSAPTGAQADQFLHAFYYKQTMTGNKAKYEEFFERNRHQTEATFENAVNWWRTLPESEHEANMLNIKAPALQQTLTEERIGRMNLETFTDAMRSVNAFTDHARRVRNATVGLPAGHYSNEQKVVALARTVWNSNASDGARIKEALRHVLYGGVIDEVPSRLWDAVTESRLKVQGIGISTLGEIIGWALPNTFPPRNGRTSKAMRALGHDVFVHV